MKLITTNTTNPPIMNLTGMLIVNAGIRYKGINMIIPNIQPQLRSKLSFLFLQLDGSDNFKKDKLTS